MSETRMIVVDTQQIEAGLAALKSVSESIIVKDAPTCLAAKTAQRDVRNYLKDVHLKLDPFVESAKRNLQSAKDELNKWLSPAEAIDGALAQKVKDFERREREAAEAETRRINEERRTEAARAAEVQRKEQERIAAEQRKAREKELEEARKAGEINKREMEKAKKLEAEIEARAKAQAAKDAEIAAANVQTVTVAPSIPTVAGVPSRRNYKARVIDANKVPDQFWVIDELALNAEARKAKKIGEIIPGVEFYED